MTNTRTYRVVTNSDFSLDTHRSGVNAILYVDSYRVILDETTNDDIAWEHFLSAEETPRYLISRTGSVHAWFDKDGEFYEEEMTTV